VGRVGWLLRKFEVDEKEEEEEEENARQIPCCLILPFACKSSGRCRMQDGWMDGWMVG
jgi:hypothetical protein